MTNHDGSFSLRIGRTHVLFRILLLDLVIASPDLIPHDLLVAKEKNSSLATVKIFFTAVVDQGFTTEDSRGLFILIDIIEEKTRA